jgi:hypothetical protein
MPALRIAVAKFPDFWVARAATDELIATGIELAAITMVADLRSLLGIPRPALKLASLREHSFADGRTLLCSETAFGRLIASRARDGAPSLSDALAGWMLPRHAGTLCVALEQQQVLVWVELHDPDDERTASLCLLRLSQGAVGVHDIPLPA